VVVAKTRWRARVFATKQAASDVVDVQVTWLCGAGACAGMGGGECAGVLPECVGVQPRIVDTPRIPERAAASDDASCFEARNLARWP
jgi:hypothetical protein